MSMTYTPATLFCFIIASGFLIPLQQDIEHLVNLRPGLLYLYKLFVNHDDKQTVLHSYTMSNKCP
jgi:hypothetical protein